MAKVIQTNCIQTMLDEFTGKLIGYRLTLPVPKEFADTCQAKYIQYSYKNKVRYFVCENKEYEALEKIKVEVQIKVTGMKIALLQSRKLQLMQKFSRL